jgi:hypothetical protein
MSVSSTVYQNIKKEKKISKGEDYEQIVAQIDKTLDKGRKSRPICPVETGLSKPGRY